MITINARTKDLDDVGLLFHAILRYGEAHGERLDQSIVSIGYGTLLNNADQAALCLANQQEDEGDAWDGCVWLQRLEDTEEGSLAHMLYADGVDVEQVVKHWLARFE